MDFEYQTTGFITLQGCAEYEIIGFYVVDYTAGSVVYPRYKALVGVMETVVIKKVFQKSANHYQNIYVDTFNRAWLEDELLPFSTAKNLALAYLEGLAEDAQDAFCSL